MAVLQLLTAGIQVAVFAIRKTPHTLLNQTASGVLNGQSVNQKKLRNFQCFISLQLWRNVDNYPNGLRQFLNSP